MRTDIDIYLKELAGQGKLVYHPNTGNAGDSLIAYATFQMFGALGLPFELYEEDNFDPEGKILIYGGGGILVPDYTAGWRFVERHHKAVKKLIILPHTICGNENLLGQLGPNVDIFTREKVSFEYVKQNASAANVFLADDLAFRLNAEQILASGPGLLSLLLSRHLSAKRTFRGAAVCAKAVAGRSFHRSGLRVLNCFRTDKERTDVHRPASNVDLSNVFKYGTSTPEQAFLATYMIFRLMSHYDEVHTNRLHMAIAGALLGKKVHVYPNSYYKCEAVYNFSMKDRFPNVQWMG